jgi:uncharacterized protein YgfB (UPF0149 family)
MTNKTSSAQNRRITLRLSLEEFDNLQGKLLSSTCQDLNELLHGIIQNGAVATGDRSPSVDDFMAVATGIKNELNAIGKNFNQAVKRLHQIYYQSSMKDDVETYDAAQFSLIQNIEEIKSILSKAYGILQKKTP